MTAIPEVTVQELKQLRDNDEEFYLLDVRRDEEREIASIDGTLIPMDELPSRIDELEEHRDERIVVYCRSGGRSAKAVHYLRSMGYDAYNLNGGILAWSREIDPDVPMY